MRSPPSIASLGFWMDCQRTSLGKLFDTAPSKGGKLSTQDSGTADPEYDAIKSFILTEAQTNQTMAVYDSERSLRERTSTSISDALRQDTSGKASAPTQTLSPPLASKKPFSVPILNP